MRVIDHTTASFEGVNGASIKGEPHSPIANAATSPEEVQNELERILANPRFVSSPRCQLLLRYVVEKAISGTVHSLKERSVGIDVFKRDPAYNTSDDPVVRMAAGEVRKKLAQYYCEPENRDRLRIELPVGSYMPQFVHLSAAPTVESPRLEFAVEQDETPQTPPKVLQWNMNGQRKSIVAAVCALLVIVAAIWGWRTNEKRNVARFWEPFVSSSTPVLLCPGQLIASSVLVAPVPSRSPNVATMALAKNAGTQNMPVAVLNDSITLANIAGFLRSEHQQFTARPVGSTSYQDLQKSPAVLIGALDNDWTMHIMQNMRFRFNQDPQRREWWISDQNEPNAKLGLQKFAEDIPLSQDMAIIARVTNSETGQPILVAAGLTSEGTLAAGNFLVSPQYLEEFLRSVPANWRTKNLEIVLSVRVVEGQPALPRVVASNVW